MSPLRALVVDDEPLSRDRLKDLLALAEDIQLAGECSNGQAAVQAIRSLAPDVVFLDVQMPGLDGFGVIEALEPFELPYVIFVTAFDQFAVRAFEVHALDYLLKPFDAGRFERTLARIRAAAAMPDGHAERNGQIQALLSEQRARAARERRVIARVPGRVRVLRAGEIDWVQAAGNYIELHVGSETITLHGTMETISGQLGTEIFARIHRSYIVNLDRIVEIHPAQRGDGSVLLNNGAKLPLSRNYREQIEALLG